MVNTTKGEIRITITGTRIYPYRKGQCRMLENMTSIKDKVGYGFTRKPITGFLIPDDEEVDKKYGTFITHLEDPRFLQDLFPDYIVRYDDSNDGRQLNHYLSLNADVTPREAQEQIIEQIIRHEESHQWFVYLSQGLGKTLLSVYMIPYFNTKTLIMCYNTSILKQWHETFKDRTNINLDSVLLIDESKIFDGILDGTFPFWEYDIFMCTPKILTMYGKRKGFEYLSILMDKMGIGLKIFDEAHRNITNIIKINAYTSVNKTLYLSGDFAQSNKRIETLYYRIFHGVPVLRPTNILMNTLKYTVAWVVSYNSHPTEADIDATYMRRGFNFFNYMKYQIKIKEFYETLWYILDAINASNDKNYRILVLLNLIEQVNILYEKIEDHYPNRYIIGRYHSKINEDEKRFARNEANLIVSTHQSFGVGIDIEEIKYVISCTICTKIDDNQASGRARPLADRSDAYYFIMYDRGFPYARKTIGPRLDYLSETKIKAIKSIKL